MKDFFNGLEGKILKAIKIEFAKIKRKVKKEKIYAIALVTDNDCITLRLSITPWNF